MVPLSLTGGTHRVRIVGTFRRFPTLDPGTPAVIVDLPTYLDFSLTDEGHVVEPSTWWLRTRGRLDRDRPPAARGAVPEHRCRLARRKRARAARGRRPPRRDRRPRARVRRRGGLRRGRLRSERDGCRTAAHARVRGAALPRPRSAAALRRDRDRECGGGRALARRRHRARSPRLRARAPLRRAGRVRGDAGSARAAGDPVADHPLARTRARGCARGRLRRSSCGWSTGCGSRRRCGRGRRRSGRERDDVAAPVAACCLCARRRADALPAPAPARADVRADDVRARRGRRSCSRRCRGSSTSSPTTGCGLRSSTQPARRGRCA